MYAIDLSFAQSPLRPKSFAILVSLILTDQLAIIHGKSILREQFLNVDKEINPIELASSLGFLDQSQRNNQQWIEELCVQSIQAESNKKMLEKYLKGNKNTINYFLGDVVKRSGRKVNPKSVPPVLERLLSAMS